MSFNLADQFNTSTMTPADEKPDFFADQITDDSSSKSEAVLEEEEDDDYFNPPEPRPRQDSFHQSSDNLLVGL